MCAIKATQPASERMFELCDVQTNFTLSKVRKSPTNLTVYQHYLPNL